MKTQHIFLNNHILLRSAYSTPEMHAHTALHLLVGIDDDILCDFENEKSKGQIIFIDSDVYHTAKSVCGEFLVFLFDPTSDISKQIREKYLDGKQYVVMQNTSVIVDKNDTLEIIDKTILHQLDLYEKDSSDYDERIKKVIQFINSLSETPENLLETLLDMSGLSKSRFSHLFKEETGISYRHYLVIFKMKKFYENYLKGYDITTSSLNAGFDSPSHFAAVCKRQFGLSFTDFSKTT